jgi:uncharacterized membrane protein
MTTEQLDAIVTAQTQILEQLRILTLLFGLLVFAQVIGVIAVCFLAAWSVARVVRSFAEQNMELKDQWHTARTELRDTLQLMVRTLRPPA